MPWFKSDDQFPQHPKVLAIPRRERVAAVGLWSLAGMWCAGQLTDGFVPDYLVEELAGTPKLAQRLVTVGLWEAVDGGFQMHDYLEYNPSAEDVRADQRRRSEAKARAGRAGGIASGVARRKHEGSSDEAERKQEGSKTKPRPVPSPSTSNEVLAPVADAPSDEPDPFVEFWKHYPRKTQKRDAEKAYRRALKRADAGTILDGLRRYPFKADLEFVPQAERWLNGDRWEDQAQLSITTPPPGGTWTEAQLTAVLGPDRWRAPQPPSSVPVDDQWEWVRDQLLAHRQDRIRQAIAKQQGGVA